jgi:hypothetical protein
MKSRHLLRKAKKIGPQRGPILQRLLQQLNPLMQRQSKGRPVHFTSLA